VASGHRYELFLEKTGYATYIIGQYWNSFCRSHNIALHDVVTFTPDKTTEEEEDEEAAEDDEDGDEEGFEEDDEQ
jgi:hypothetical protein